MRRRVQPGSGSSLAFLRTRRSIAVPALTPLLAGHPYVVVGGVATALYMPARQTDDVDVLVTTSQYGEIERVLTAAGAQQMGPLALGGALGTRGFGWQLADGSEIDVLLSGSPWARDAVAHPSYDSNGVPIVALPYLVLMKLDAGRGVDIGDLSRMLGLADDEALEATRRVVRANLPDALEDLESLIQLGGLEVQAVSAEGTVAAHQPPGA